MEQQQFIVFVSAVDERGWRGGGGKEGKVASVFSEVFLQSAHVHEARSLYFLDSLLNNAAWGKRYHEPDGSGLFHVCCIVRRDTGHDVWGVR